MPFALLTVAVLVWGIPAIKPGAPRPSRTGSTDSCRGSPGLPWLHLKVAKGEAVTGHADAGAR